jgi:hypothetical protein
MGAADQNPKVSMSPYLSSHRNEPTREDAMANAGFMPFGEEEDTALIGLVNKIGNRWKRISKILGQHFPHRTRIEIKNRAKWLLDTRRNTQSLSRRQDESPDPIIEKEIPVEATRGENFDPVKFFTEFAFPTTDSQIE